MKNVEFKYLTRIGVNAMLADARAGSGGIDKLDALMGVLRKIRFSDEESAGIEIQEVGQGRYRYSLREPESVHAFNKTVELEEAEVLWLRRAITDWMPNAGLTDLEWVKPLMAGLDEPEKVRMPVQQFKKRRSA